MDGMTREIQNRYATPKIAYSSLRVMTDIKYLLSILEEKEIYIEQLRGALGYSVSGDIRENPDIHNGIAEALHQQISEKEARIKGLEGGISHWHNEKVSEARGYFHPDGADQFLIKLIRKE